MKTALKRASMALVATMIAAPLAAEAPVKAGTVMIQNAWARATVLEGRPGAVYLTLHNMSKRGDALVSAKSPVAKRVELHTHKKDGKVLRMMEVKRIPVAVGQKVVLKPGGYHIMLMQRTRPLKKGASFPLTLSFESGATATVQVKVMGPGASGPKGGAGGHHKHH